MGRRIRQEAPFCRNESDHGREPLLGSPVAAREVSRHLVDSGTPGWPRVCAESLRGCRPYRTELHESAPPPAACRNMPATAVRMASADRFIASHCVRRSAWPMAGVRSDRRLCANGLQEDGVAAANSTAGDLQIRHRTHFDLELRYSASARAPTRSGKNLRPPALLRGRWPARRAPA